VVPAVDDAHFSRREFGQDDRDEVLYFHFPRQPGVHARGQVDQVGLAERHLAEDGQDGSAPADRV